MTTSAGRASADATRDGGPNEATTASARGWLVSTMARSSKPSVDANCRAARLPTAPAPISTARTRLPQVGSGEFTPAAVLWRDPTGSAKPQQTGDHASRSQCQQGTPERLHVGLVRIELTTSALSVLRSNRLSYSPERIDVTRHPATAPAANRRPQREAPH